MPDAIFNPRALERTWARNYERIRDPQKLLDDYPQDIRKYAAKQALIRMDNIEEQIRQELKQGS